MSNFNNNNENGNNTNDNSNILNSFPGLFTSSQYGNNQPLFPSPPGFGPIHQPTININELLHTNHILNTNLMTLNNMYMSNHMMLTEQINSLKRTNEELEKKIKDKRNNDNYDDCRYDNCNREQKKSKRDYYQKDYNRYQIRRYYPNSKSWSDEKINDFLKDMREIKDILK